MSKAVTVLTHPRTGQLVRVDLFCAVHSLPYIKEGRRCEDGKFRVIRTLALTAEAQEARQAKGLGAPSPQRTDETALSEWDWDHDTDCPYCGEVTIFGCHCDLLICQGRSYWDDDGARWLVCPPGCGNVSRANGTIERVNGRPGQAPREQVPAFPRSKLTLAIGGPRR